MLEIIRFYTNRKIKLFVDPDMLHLFPIGCLFTMVMVYMMPIGEELLVPIYMKEEGLMAV
jgi:hypothetical protein